MRPPERLGRRRRDVMDVELIGGVEKRDLVIVDADARGTG
jgi:hypothetical protein